MSEQTLPGQYAAPVELERRGLVNALSRVAKYTFSRLATMVFSVVLGVYLTVLIANMGGHVDEIRRAQIADEVSMIVLNDPQIRSLSQEEKAARIEAMIALREKRYGLDQPFVMRSLNFTVNALRLDLGFAEAVTSDSGSRQVRLIMLERLPSTLVLFATANLLLFFLSVFTALFLSRQYGSLMDKFVIAMAPTSAAPGWFYGIFLILIFAALLRILPYGGMVDAPPPDDPFLYFLSLLKHMILPVTALTMSSIFYSIYSWRTFFLIYSSEDYVDVAKAKGLNAREIERRYILRPTLPFIITNFALLLIGLWSGAIIFETVFNWPGLGRVLFRAIGLYDTPVIVGSAVIFAYLLAITVFILDFVYALVDPRVKIGEGSRT